MTKLAIWGLRIAFLIIVAAILYGTWLLVRP